MKATDGSVVASGKLDNGVYMRYRIVSIDNRDSTSKVFHFNPAKIANSSQRNERPVNEVIGLTGAIAFDVAPNTLHAEQHNVTIKNMGNLVDVKNQVIFLLYESGQNEHVIMANDDPKVSSVPLLSPLKIPGDNPN